MKKNRKEKISEEEIELRRAERGRAYNLKQLEKFLKRGQKECNEIINKVKKHSKSENMLNNYVDEEDFVEDLPSICLIAEKVNDTDEVKDMLILRSAYYSIKMDRKAREQEYVIPLDWKGIDNLLENYDVNLGSSGTVDNFTTMLFINWNEYMLNRAKEYFPDGFFSGRIKF